MSLLTRTGPTPRVTGDPAERSHRRHGRTDARPPRGRPSHRELVRRDLAAYARRVGLDDLVRTHGSPLFVLDPARVAAQVDELRRELPRTGIHFATKSLPHPAVIDAVHASGASFEVASRGEVDLLERHGVPIGACLHTHPVKTVADITGAYLRGIRTFVVDSPSEIGKFAGLPCCDVGVLVRLSFPNPGAKSDLSSKFGVAPEHAAALVERCLAARLRVRGFTFHVGSQTTSAEPWRRAIDATLRLMRTLEARHGIRFELLDLGGGFPVAYDEPVPSLGELARGIRSALAAVPPHVRVVVEPGRFIAAPAMTLVTRVIGTSDRADGRWHYLDEGLYGAYSNIPAEDVHALVFAAAELGVEPDRPVGAADALAARRPARRRVPVTLAGPTCDSVDVIARRLPLPPLADGDLLVSPMMGAYTWATATGFNGIAPTPVVVLPEG
ncbi:Lysine/ornithine decarboxylase [Agromyces sp. NDB4Y10]|uniref:type III PLP-dependent enzyme n=1 Tax=Agromyces sp. NDB4Y10 TaxID=1775951 RepID=UPI0007B2663F|nr:type III PLP-dependent enzyme [Agromyces sp. NDB4Y10]KZE95666.1 Lysine/ornithine decarboxylase [Agromyces sp. NDB4Y10]